MTDLISRADAIDAVRLETGKLGRGLLGRGDILDIISALPSAEAVQQSEQYKKGFEDAKRAFLLEYARESENMSKRNAELTVMLNAYRATARPQGEWVRLDECSVCGKQAFDFIEGCVEGVEYLPNYCPNCGARMKGGDDECL